MHFSVWPDPGRPVDEVLDLARFADDLGWFGFWFADHYMPNTGDTSLKAGDVHEVWGVLPAVAAVTKNIRIGPLVSPTSVHHPAVLANRAATIDHVSNGRFVLGLGAGWQVNEHAAYGIELESPGDRVSRFDEAIQITRSLLDTDRTTFDGRFYTLNDAPSDPSPVQNKLPITVGTGGPRMLRITARHAQEWNTWGGPEMAGDRRHAYEMACDDVGVDPASLHTSVQALVVMTDDAESLASIRSGDMGGRSIAGSNTEIVEQLGQLRDLGFDELIVPDFTLGATAEQRREAYENFAANIAPQLA